MSEVARRHDITPQHLFGWRKAARTGRLVLPAAEPPMFVPIVTATGGSAPGTYPSTCAGAADANYTFSYVGGSVTMTASASRASELAKKP